MKKIFLVVALIGTVLLSACSLFEEVNNSLDYANDAVDHVNKIVTFGEDAPQKLQEAVADPEAKEQFEHELTELKEDIAIFNELEPPTIAEEVHEQLMAKNRDIERMIGVIMKNGEIAVDQLEQMPLGDLQITDTLMELKELKTQLEKLGQ